VYVWVSVFNVEKFFQNIVFSN